MIVLLLGSTRSHVEYYLRDFSFDPEKVKVICPQEERELWSIRPDLMIELPGWMDGQSRKFTDAVNVIKHNLNLRRKKRIPYL